MRKLLHYTARTGTVAYISSIEMRYGFHTSRDSSAGLLSLVRVDMRSQLPKLAHLLSHPRLSISLHSVLVTTPEQCLGLPSPYDTLINSSLPEKSGLHVRAKYSIINFDANSCQITAIDTLALLATYNYEESIPGLECQAKAPTWAVLTFL